MFSIDSNSRAGCVLLEFNVLSDRGIKLL